MTSTFHTAGWVMVDPEHWIQRGVVEVIDGTVHAVHRSQRDRRVIDHGPGVIMPALVNAHAHLSLSALQGRVDTTAGFTDWVKRLIELRAGLAQEEVSSAAMQAAQGAKLSGTGCIAEVGPVEPGASAMAQAGLHGVVFSEFLGNHAEGLALPSSNEGVTFGYAGHALHTTAPDLLARLKLAALEHHTVFSLHLAESTEETEFLGTGRGAWAELLESRGIDFSTWDLRGERPVHRAERLGLLGMDTVAVHLLEVTAEDMETLARSGTRVCVCPRSNAALHGRLPDIEGFIEAGLPVALGTDSLASAPSLDLFEEMAFVSEHFPGLRPKLILSMATVNGAQALDIQDEGSIEPGKKARLIYVDLEADSARSAASLLVSSSCEQIEWI